MNGFIALSTAIILSIILITVAVSLNLAGFLARGGIIDAQFKEESLALAEACADRALLDLANDKSYTSGETIKIGSENCKIRTIKKNTPAPSKETIETIAAVNEAHTNLRIIVNSSDLSVISWREVAEF